MLNAIQMNSENVKNTPRDFDDIVYVCINFFIKVHQLNIVPSHSLNFIRLLRVVITPSVTTLLRGENDSKQSDEFQATINIDCNSNLKKSNE